MACACTLSQLTLRSFDLLADLLIDGIGDDDAAFAGQV